MSTEVSDFRRLRLWLCLLLAVSCVLSVLALRPSAVVQSLVGIAPTESTQELVHATLVANADASVASIATFDDPALQDLAADSDLETRLEVQTLRAMVDEEAADYH